MPTPPEDTNSVKPERENPPDCSKFVHSRLKDPQKDIRLFELLPGSFKDDIKLRIFHTTLPKPKRETKRPMMYDELRNTLPLGWNVYQTRTGRYIYGLDEADGLKTTWTHPDSTYHWLLEDTSLVDNDTDAQRFEALSHAHGSTQNPQQVYVECSSRPHGFSTLDISQNLASALVHLRHGETTRTLWADAICVNPSNPEEKNTHVHRLADIISRASRVVAWLGPASENSAEAFEALQHLGEQVVPVALRPMEVEEEWVPAPGATEPDWYLPIYDLPFSEETIYAIEKLLQRDWFQRTWVLQEIILASSQSIIQCGRSQMPWLIFNNAVCSLQSRGACFSESFQEALVAPVRMSPDPKPRAIVDILLRYRAHQTSDPRDKVYGLLGLLPPEFRQKITPQYDAPVAKVYTDLALALIEHTRRLDLLGAWNSEKTENAECPSWVLDFREPPYVRKPLSHQFCTLHSACHVRFQPPNELRVTGIKIATLSHGFKMPPVDKDIWDGTHEAMIEIIRRVPHEDIDTSTYGSGESLRQAYAISLVAGNLRSRFRDDTSLATLDEWVLQNSANALFGEHAVKGVTDVENLSVSERDALDKVAGRMVAVSIEGMIGLCPRASEIGDVVAVLLGCQSPMLLRPQPEGRYKVVGECYMHGLSDGGALLGSLADPRAVIIFQGPHGLWDVWGVLNRESKVWTAEDPRLPPFSDEWEWSEIERTRNDPAVCRFFRNKVTGEVINSDPRLTPEALKERGVKLEEIVLI
ncbi:hypothetical protein ACHAPT_000563 [Fusarium lateritium]